LQYVTEGNRVIGEFAVSRRNGEFRLEFSKGGAVPLIRVSRHQGYGRAEGALARGSWEGLATKAPDALSGWVNEVPRGFAGLGTIELAAKSAARTPGVPGGSAPRRMEIEGTREGERFVFIFGQ
ncbi:MAG TPA: hypothetical protein VFG14_05345, partial [Chthoniobacteraceae bacterium]|nr:hypothetical protein [Chthoniobacteraceae bacterium]